MIYLKVYRENQKASILNAKYMFRNTGLGRWFIKSNIKTASQVLKNRCNLKIQSIKVEEEFHVE